MALQTGKVKKKLWHFEILDGHFGPSFERHRPDVQCSEDYSCHVEVRKTHSQVNIDASDAQRKPLHIRGHLVNSFLSFSLHWRVSQRSQDFEICLDLAYFGSQILL